MATPLFVPLFALLFLSPIPTRAQQIGMLTPEIHPLFQTQQCTSSGTCTTKQTSLVTDALSRHFHTVADPSVSCASADFISNPATCNPDDPASCAASCALEGIEYGGIGVSSLGSAVTLRQYLFDGTEYRAVSPRVYLLAEDGENYEPMRLLNQELAVDVDVSKLPCGMNSAVYLSEMDLSGSRSESNPAGAGYGTGYCDAQCFRTVPWINGLPNINSSGACCNEMDIWEANSRANSFTPHTCSSPGSFLCSGEEECGKGAPGVCDKDGCGLNTYNLGNPSFYGLGLDIDSSKPFTIVTQFPTNEAGELIEIKRIYIQNGEVIPNTADTTDSRFDSIAYEGSITQDFCAAKNSSDYLRLGGMKGMGEALARGMVLVFSLWNSESDFMSWLDGLPNNGPCNATEGDPALIRAQVPDVSMTFSNVRWGDIGSTFSTSGEANKEEVVTGGNIVTGKAVTAENRGTRVNVITGAVLGLAVMFGFMVSA
ncbi:concanavalin A-like lectin/glucanase domain-containing protein [Triangularia verruculosa]|uniref:Glucanase n=1 Tax=Triangularia verruculosa TaxID=2587418 RepID=A0AAN6XKZ9_9PEZI|nr:concanavalin A-like lectin/glucanase domain-containing protein [Triangularia verruculosa]